MNFLISFFDINNIFFTAFSYHMSYLEFFGTIFTIVSAKGQGLTNGQGGAIMCT